LRTTSPICVATLGWVRVSLCALLLTVAAALGPAAAAAPAAPLPADFFGTNSPDLMRLSPSERIPVLADQRAAGVRLIRHLFDWSDIERAPGDYDWAPYDSFVESAARADMEILPLVLWTPDWATSCPGARNPSACAPVHLEDFGNFVAVLVRRYGPSGSFWANNPTVPKRPVTAWQLWNEPSLPSYWNPAPNAQEYVNMVAAAAPIIRAADPSAEIVSAGIPDSRLPGAIPQPDYVSAMYAAGLRGLVDDVAIHIYNETPAGAVRLVEQTRAIMNANGDASTPIWITEWGWASAGAPYRFVTDLPGQAANMDSLMGQLVARHSELGLRALTQYLWHDGSAQSNVTDFWANHLGLVFVDYSHKPSYDVFQHHAIDMTPPDTVISASPSGNVAPGPQSIAFASSEAGSDFECQLDASGWAPCASPFAMGTLPAGEHTFLVRSTDPYGNTDPSPAGAGWVVTGPANAVAGAHVNLGAIVARGARALAKRLARLDPRTLGRHRSFKLSASWPAAGRITLALRGRTFTVARGSRLLAHPGKASLTLRLSSKGRRLLLGSRRVRLTLSEEFTPASRGTGAAAHTKFTLSRR
jgi:hypothetical protein